MRLHRPVAVLAALALALGAAACGDGDSDTPVSSAPPSGTAATTAPATETPGEPVESATGARCISRPPDPAPEPPTYSAPPELTIDPAVRYRATLRTSCGTIVIALDARNAPATVNNFVFLARAGYFDGLTFHRVVSGFVIQGGDPAGDGTGGPGYTIPDELPDDGYPAGSVAMANAGPDTGGSQFFIVTGDASFLPNAYSKFGRVVRGLDVARDIESFVDPDLDPGDPAAQVPTAALFIDSVTISEGGG